MYLGTEDFETIKETLYTAQQWKPALYPSCEERVNMYLKPINTPKRLRQCQSTMLQREKEDKREIGKQ